MQTFLIGLVGLACFVVGVFIGGIVSRVKTENRIARRLRAFLRKDDEFDPEEVARVLEFLKAGTSYK
jgi:hypothetical protein